MRQPWKRGRPAAAARPHAVLYTQPGCHLCEDTEAHLARLAGRYPHTLEVVDINAEPELRRRYWDRIPVLVIGGREYEAPLSPTLLERVLREHSR